MREFLVFAAVAAAGLAAPAAVGAPAAPSTLSAAAVSAALALDPPEETCEERSFRTVCIPRCRDLPLAGQWGSVDGTPNKGECLSECTREVNAQCQAQSG